MPDVVERPEEYFRELVPERSELLIRLEEEAGREGIPIVGPVVGELLYILARAIDARRIVELGTATGYSAIYLAGALARTNGRLVSVEHDDRMAARARLNVETAGLSEFVDVRVGDAARSIAELEAGVDMIFLDIEKEDYEPVLGQCRRLLRSGGLLVADNVAFEKSDPFNRRIRSEAGWRTVSIFGFLPQHSPEHDGLCLALRL
jgi:predicted O-methyltransferase YrrM